MTFIKSDWTVKLQSSSSSHVKWRASGGNHLFKVTAKRTGTDEMHVFTNAKMPKRMCVCVYVDNVTRIKIKPLAPRSNVRPLTFRVWPAVPSRPVSRRLPRAGQEEGGLKIIFKCQHSVCWRTDWQIEVSCRERRESVPIQVVNRRWRERGVEEKKGGEKGGLLLPLHNKSGKRAHISFPVECWQTGKLNRNSQN